ncbi:hypothetical protein HHK36_005853 [Tetracentron sinense]|uniref:NPH3 domain-containing protein n=1 Tax=Tetracentron sinense TaxID=13715 RepID=A0A835DR11_TETSI|nr:hypothetical protein HHK36_005853 [Tetracentron sinense]
MKFMKLGTRQDTFYTEEATRSVSSDIPSDLIIQINNIKYLLHKFSLLPKCGLLQRLCINSGDPSNGQIELHDIPGGKESFELCAKFCYGITINLSAQNFVPAFCAAKFLRMTESNEKGNLVLKLEAFFNSCILEGWKDSIVTLQTTGKLPEWSENLGVIRRCTDSVVEKILTHPSKVTWSYTYTRPGYAEKRHLSVPKDWWTEDISSIDIDLFRCIITTVRSTNMLPPQLIGEALHVYACRWLPDTSKSKAPESSESQNDAAVKHRRVLETIVSMIPTDRMSVSIGFWLRLVNEAYLLRVSPSTKAELIRRSSWQLEEATISDLVFPSHSSDQHFYDIDLVETVLESFLVQWRRQAPPEDSESIRSIRKVAKLIDSYLQVVVRDVNMPALKVVHLAESLPEIARPKHDEIYKAINIYLKEHPNLSKAEKKRLCRILDCQKLSPEVCAHVVRNERLPLRTVVQVLFYEQERGTRPTNQKLQPSENTFVGQHLRSITGAEDHIKPKWDPDVRSNGIENRGKATMPSIAQKDHHNMMKSDERMSQESERKAVKKVEGKEIKEEGGSGSTSKQKMIEKKTKSDHGHYKVRDR